MKKAITLLAIIFSVAISRAQYVSIPDTTFGNWLYANGYLACMAGNGTTGWRIDTTCAAVLNSTTMTISNLNKLQYLQGIQYFKGLTNLSLNNLSFFSSLPALPPALITFKCEGSSYLTSLPALPGTLRTLVCNLCQLNTLPVLPASLSYLDCSTNALHALPTLPDSLVYLNCNQNMLGAIPALPGALTYLNCSRNNLTSSLPALPESLDTLICNGDDLSGLPALANSLVYINCENNHISSLPVLPQTLNFLDCLENHISVMPSLPASLATLFCNNNNIASLPSLPALLTFLDCSYNSLTYITPPLPDSLSWFNCSNNTDLSCLPHLNAVVHFNFTNTAVTCLPDLPSSNTYTNPTVAVCTGGDTCPTPNGINQLAAEHFSVYPNPASNYIMVESSELIGQLAILNMLGQTVYSATGNKKMAMSFDVSLWPAGVYIVEAYSAHGINATKIIVGN